MFTSNRPTLASVSKTWENARIVQPQLCFSLILCILEYLVQLKSKYKYLPKYSVTSWSISMFAFINLVFVGFIDRPDFLLWLFSFCNIVCSELVFSANMIMSLANLRLFSFIPFIIYPKSSNSKVLNIFSNTAIKSFGEPLSPCLTPFWILNCSLVCSYCNFNLVIL